MLNVIINIIISGVMACVFHETGHYLVCKMLTGIPLEFKFQWGYLFDKIPVPRFVWYMPKTEYRKQRAIAAAGFITEAIICIPLLFAHNMISWIYPAIVTIHYFAYPYYAGDASDLNWLK